MGMSERIGVRYFAACGRGCDERVGFSVDAVRVPWVPLMVWAVCNVAA